MAYIDYEYYKSLYVEKVLTEQEFNRILWDAEREIDKATSGVDGVKKLKVAFPADEEDAESVKRCSAELVSFICTLNKAQNGIVSCDGTVNSNIVTSKSAGNESIAYANVENSISTALRSVKDREKIIYQFISSKLSGVSDANGVKLLFAGRYPYEVKNVEI